MVTTLPRGQSSQAQLNSGAPALPEPALGRSHPSFWMPRSWIQRGVHTRCLKFKGNGLATPKREPQENTYQGPCCYYIFDCGLVSAILASWANDMFISRGYQHENHASYMALQVVTCRLGGAQYKTTLFYIGPSMSFHVELPI